MGDNTSIAKQLDAGLLIFNGYDAGGPELHARLSQVGYDGAALNVLRQLWAKAGGARSTALGEHGDQYRATEALELLQKKVEAQISTAAQIARTAFVADIDARTTLGLELPNHSTSQPAANGAVPSEPPQSAGRDQSLAGLLDRGRIFYGNALSHPEILAVLSSVGYNATRLQQELNEVTTLGTTDAVQEREKSEATASTASQKAALKDLKLWIQRFRGIVVPALKDKPDYLKALGLKPRGGQR